MKIVIPGGSGQIGQVLARSLSAEGHDVAILSRSGRSHVGRGVSWDGRTLDAWTSEIDGADVVINLAGRSVNCRYSERNLREMMDSRVDSTRIVGRAIAEAGRPPRVWLQMSTATIYRHSIDHAADEAGAIGGGEPDVPAYWARSVVIAREWERTLDEADTPSTRKVAMRTAMMMSPDRGGIFDVLLGLVRMRLGGNAGSGRQYVSWIHDADFLSAVRFLIEREDIDGAVNLAAPGPLPYRDFMRALRHAAGVGIGLPAAKWMLEIGAFVMRTDTELVLKSRRVVPGRLLAAGFRFGFADWQQAARDLVARWRALRSGSNT